MTFSEPVLANILAAFAVFSGGLFSLVILGALPRTNRSPGAVHLTACFGSLFFIQLFKSVTMLLTVEQAAYYRFFFSYNILGTLFAAGFVNLVSWRLGFSRSNRFSFYIPAILFTIAYLVWIILPGTNTRTAWLAGQLTSNLYQLMITAWVLFHFRWLFRKRQEPANNNLKVIRRFYVIVLLVSAYVTTGYVFKVTGLSIADEIQALDVYKIRFILQSVIVGVLLFIILRKPDLFEEVSETDRKEYLNSYLSRLDVRDLAESLQTVFESEKPYLEPDFDKNHLAARLDVTSHQLGELLNKYFGRSFSEMTNDYRIQAACKALLADPKQPVIDIAFAAGYSSKSVFNSQFKKRTGLSPGRYRQTNTKSTVSD